MDEHDITEQAFKNGYEKGKQDAVKWIPVSDPPKKDGDYIVFQQGAYGKTMRTLSFAKDGRKVDRYDFHREWRNVWYYYSSEWGHITVDTVTHWMPLPEPPKGE